MKQIEHITPEVLDKVKILCKRHNISLLDKMLKEENVLNFKSLLTEAYFALFFDEIGVDLKYNFKAFKNSSLTPDFLFTKNSQEILAEVCRVNPSQKDIAIQQEENSAIQEFKKIEPDIPVIGSYHPIIWKPEKLRGRKSSLSNKANKYGPLVE